MNTFMKFVLLLCGATALATAVTAQNAPTINFDSAPNALMLPDDIYLGEVGGVATNSRGDIFVYTRTGHPTMSIASARPFVHGGSRLFQFDRNGKYTREIGQGVYGFLFDAQGNVYAADGGNQRIQVFDNNGAFKTEIKNVGNAQAICITPGATQVMYVSNSNPPEDLDTAGEIYKMRLDGTLVGKFGRAGKLLKEFGTVNAIDCRTENVLYVGEVGNFRVQKLTLR